MQNRSIPKDIEYRISTVNRNKGMSILYEKQIIVNDTLYDISLEFALADVLNVTISVTDENGTVQKTRKDIWRCSDLEEAIPRSKGIAEKILSEIVSKTKQKAMELPDILDTIANIPIKWKDWDIPLYRELDNCIYVDIFYIGDTDLFLSINGIENTEPYWGRTGITGYYLHIEIHRESEMFRIHNRYSVRVNDCVLSNVVDREFGAKLRTFKMNFWLSAEDIIAMFKDLSDAEDFQTAYSKLRSRYNPKFSNKG